MATLIKKKSSTQAKTSAKSSAKAKARADAKAKVTKRVRKSKTRSKPRTKRAKVLKLRGTIAPGFNSLMTMPKMQEMNKPYSGLQAHIHPKRRWSPIVHQGPGGVFFVYNIQGEEGYRVRQFFPSGHTSYTIYRRYHTEQQAHTVAEKYALKGSKTNGGLPENLNSEDLNDRRGY